MKQFYQNSITVASFVLGTLLLGFSSCQSTDNKTSEGAAVANLPLTVQIDESSSRVGINGTYGNVFSHYWNSDKLDIYQKYALSGTIQSMMPLEFSTAATSGTSATFSYTGNDSYRYNPGARLYAYSSGTSGNYSANVTSDGVSTLAATTLASQNGTLDDCAKYDALYGSTMVNNSTGLPELLTMHHVFGMLNFHLTSSTFSTNYPVTVTFTSSAANILPGNNGNATLKADGTFNSLVGSWGSNWYATVTPTTNGVVDIYLMTWPLNAINGSLSISCSDGTGNVYTEGKVTLNNFSLSAAQIKSMPLEITSTPPAFSDVYSQLYAWDAINYQPVTIGKVPPNANTTVTANDYLNHASYACANCPNANEISWYLSVPCYWDKGSISGGNTTSYKLADGSTTKAGMWFKKKSGIPGFSAATSSEKKSGTVITLTNTLVSTLDLRTNYFFLPANGYLLYNTGAFAGSTFGGGGAYGGYWSSTPYSGTMYAYKIGFNNTRVDLIYLDRTEGYCLWQAQ